MILTSIYNAPVSYYALLLKHREAIVLEQYDHYTKQTYRNRCRILGANGRLDLVIPVVKNHGKKVHMKDVKIDYDTDWQKNHWRSIVSAYASAPFFEFIEDAYVGFYFRKEAFLLDLNMGLMEVALDQLQLKTDITLSDAYKHQYNDYDARESIHPKRGFRLQDHLFQPAIYQQVFSEKHGFVPELSIMDLLFNEGPNARMILEQSLDWQKETRP